MASKTLPIVGLGAFLGTLTKAGKAGTSPFGGSKNIAPLLSAFQNYERDTFNTEGGAQGRRWAPLSASTLRYRQPGPILHQSRRLRSSLTNQTRDTLIKTQGRKLMLGSKVPYAAAHQAGSSRMPARPPILATPKLAKALAQAFTRRLGVRLSE